MHKSEKIKNKLILCVINIDINIVLQWYYLKT